MTARGPKVAKTVTRSVTISTRAEFTADELRKRLRLPADAVLSVSVVSAAGEPVGTMLGLSDKALVAEWTVSK
jgi:hypothetical protein